MVSLKITLPYSLLLFFFLPLLKRKEGDKGNQKSPTSFSIPDNHVFTFWRLFHYWRKRNMLSIESWSNFEYLWCVGIVFLLPFFLHSLREQVRIQILESFIRPNLVIMFSFSYIYLVLLDVHLILLSLDLDLKDNTLLKGLNLQNSGLHKEDLAITRFHAKGWLLHWKSHLVTLFSFLGKAEETNCNFQCL